jgi:SAM-dependent methyltransferase
MVRGTIDEFQGGVRVTPYLSCHALSGRKATEAAANLARLHIVTRMRRSCQDANVLGRIVSLLSQTSEHAVPAAPVSSMIYNPSCPVCTTGGHTALSTQVFHREQKRLSGYVSERYRVLFEIWAPGAAELQIQFRYCRQCSLVYFAPRPTAAEVDAKYRRLGGAASSTVHNPTVTPVDRERSSELFQTIHPYVVTPQPEVLDFGGGTGSLMHEFVHRGYACSLVDYAPEAIAGVTRLAATMDELRGRMSFDVIVAAHVLEHVPDPRALVGQLAAALTPTGLLYVEVPMELVGGSPQLREPVTHINFFTEPSVFRVLSDAGLRVLRCWTQATIHANGRAALAVRAIASADRDRPGQSMPPSQTDTDQLLRLTGIRRSLWLATRHPLLWQRHFRGRPFGTR